MENKTIGDLNNRVWYRFLKVIFIIVFFTVLVAGNLMFIGASYDRSLDLSYDAFLKAQTGQVGANFNFSNFVKFFFIGNLIIMLFFEAIRGVFYYIVLGKFRPEK